MNIPVNLQTSPGGANGWLTGNNDARGANLAAMAGGMTGASMVESRSAEITLETMEGDRVTLSFTSQTEAAFQVYNAQGVMEGGAQARPVTFTLKSGTEMTIAIEGEISDAEKADIEKVMSAVEEMAKEFFAGDVDEALAELLEMGGVGTLAGLQVSLESSSTVTISSQGGALEDNPAGTTAVVQPPTVPPAGTDVQPIAALQPPAAPGVDAPALPAAPADQSGRITVDTTNGLVGSMASTVKEAGMDLPSAEKRLLKLMERLFDRIADQFSFGEEKHKVAEIVKSEFAAGLKEMAGHEAHETDEHGNGHAYGHARPERGHGHRHGH